MDTRSVETTIAVGQNMQMCHSLRCKQIDRSTGTQLISIQRRRGPFLRESLILVAAAHARVTEGCALTAPGRLRRLTFGLGRLKKKSGRPSRRLIFGLCENPKRNQRTHWNGTERNKKKLPRTFRLSHGSCFASVVSVPVFYGPTFLSIERRGKASNWL